MPLINVHLAAGRTDEQKKALMAALTKAAEESIGAPLQSIRVWITEMQPTEFMAGGELMADRLSSGGTPPDPRASGGTPPDRQSSGGTPPDPRAKAATGS